MLPRAVRSWIMVKECVCARFVVYGIVSFGKRDEFLPIYLRGSEKLLFIRIVL